MATHEVRSSIDIEAPRAECLIRGEAQPLSDVSLYGERDGKEAYAQFTGRHVSLTVHDVPSINTDRVGLQAATRSGFAFDGWIDRTRLTFVTRTRIPLSGDVAWIPRGAFVTLRVGDGRKVVVSPATTKLMPIDAVVRCDELAIGHVEPERSLEDVGDLYNLAGDRLAVSATPSGPPIFTLRPRSTSLVLSVQDVGDGMRLRFTDGIAVDGYVDRAALKPVTSIGMSGCSCGGAIHSVGIGFHTGMRIATARGRSVVGVGENAPGIPRGSVAKGGRVLVLEESGAYAKVLPGCREIAPQTAFWIARADLQIGGVTQNAAAACH